MQRVTSREWVQERLVDKDVREARDELYNDKETMNEIKQCLSGDEQDDAEDEENENEDN